MIAELGGMDEDFFLYHEEVAFSREAQNHGWRVEYDPSVTVIHRHPLQNRPISPMMRVITRHSKLLYFLKHLPRWQFESLAAIVWAEALIKGLWSKLLRSREDARAWGTIAAITRGLRTGRGPRGTEVLALAQAVKSGGIGADGSPVSQARRESACKEATRHPIQIRHHGAPAAPRIDSQTH
jgi:hypothetical protein